MMIKETNYEQYTSQKKNSMFRNQVLGFLNLLLQFLSLVLTYRRPTCDIAADTAWGTIPTWEQTQPATKIIAGLYRGSWLKFNFAGT